MALMSLLLAVLLLKQLLLATKGLLLLKLLLVSNVLLMKRLLLGLRPKWLPSVNVFFSCSAASWLVACLERSKTSSRCEKLSPS